MKLGAGAFSETWGSALIYKFSTECAGEKKFENRLIFGEDIDRSWRLTFLGHPAHSASKTHVRQ